MWRRVAFACACVAPLWPTPAVATDARETAAAAEAAYAAGDFGAAADAYAALTWRGGVRQADAWYNAGNAYARAGQRGAAIASLRRALELDPRHADAAANLRHLRAAIQDTDAPRTESFRAWLLRPARHVSLRAWGRLAGVAWIVCWGSAAAAVWFPRRARRLSMATGAVMLLIAGGWSARLLGQRLEPRAIVTATVAPLRTGPGPDYLVTYSLPDGAECFLQTAQAGWVQLRLNDGGTGWTEAERVLLLPTGLPAPGPPPARWEPAS